MEHARRPDHADHKRPSVASPPRATRHKPETQQLSHGKAILVVDDELEVAIVLGEVFNQDGHLVDIASNGEEALEKLRQRSFDAIVCDIRMPKMDGPAFYQALAQRYPHQVTRVLFLTGDVFNPDTQEFLQQVTAPALGKPFTVEAIREAIHHILQTNGHSS
jgi:two-component system NtrC family sensor kinase